MSAYAGPASGGGLNHTAGTATLNRVTFRGNLTNSYGGGLYVGAATLSANEMLFALNQAVIGGAVSNSGTFMLSNSLVYSNTADVVGGIGNGLAGLVVGATNNATLTNVTVSGNSAESAVTAAGVQSNSGSLALIHGTISGNQGFGLGRGSTSTLLTVKNTIIAGNLPQDCLNSLSSNGFNIVMDTSCLLTQVSDRFNTNPLLGPLSDNGGPTLSYLPRAGSPAIDAGQCVPGIMKDQRGAPRPFGAACDIGAIEVQPGDGEIRLYLPLVRK